MLLLELLFLRSENLDDQGRDGEHKPLDRNPPPADDQPPENAVMLVDELCLGHDLHIDISALTLRANHDYSSYSV